MKCRFKIEPTTDLTGLEWFTAYSEIQGGEWEAVQDDGPYAIESESDG